VRGKAYRSVDAKPETMLMSAIFGRAFKDGDLNTESDGKRLSDALWEAVDGVPDKVSRRGKRPIHVRCRDMIERHYGFTDGKMHFYKDMAGQLGVCTMSLAFYHNEVMESLRRPSVLETLRPFIKRRG